MSFVGSPNNPFYQPGEVNSGSQVSPILFVDSFMPAYQSSVDCTTQFNAALAKASQIGSSIGARCPIYTTPGRQYTVTNVVVPSFVELNATGSTINRINTATNAATFDCSSSTDVCFRGLHFLPGAGTEALQNLHQIFGNQAQRVRVFDCYASNWGQSAVYLVDSQYLWVIGNEFPSCGLQTSNGINFVNGANANVLPLKHIWCGRNFVSGFAIQVNIADSSATTRTDPDLDAHIFHNTLINLAGGKAWCMGVEKAAAGTNPIGGVEFTGNNCYQLNSFNGQGSRTYAICLINPIANPLALTDIQITGGRVLSNNSGTNRGILVDASNVTITGVTIDSGDIDIVWQHTVGGGNATKLSVAGCGSKSGTGASLAVGLNTDPTTLSMSANTPTVSGVVGVPATTVAVAGAAYNRYFYVTAGASTCTMAVQGGPSVVIPSGGFGAVYVPAGCTVTPTYTAAPTWIVQGS